VTAVTLEVVKSICEAAWHEAWGDARTIRWAKCLVPLQIDSSLPAVMTGSVGRVLSGVSFFITVTESGNPDSVRASLDLGRFSLGEVFCFRWADFTLRDFNVGLRKLFDRGTIRDRTWTQGTTLAPQP
jgi:hypothetical protein